ncbi:MAG: ATP-binding cassette domain-containing protein [Clostridia bacterium]|nr:ATP-binding cassette domain-containing protein [Clostridia bacterium]
MNAIEIRNLSKSFRGMYAVDHLNMSVPVGAIYGFIGENGSGKPTTEKMICGLIPKSGGTIKLYGKDHRARCHQQGGTQENKFGIIIQGNYR